VFNALARKPAGEQWKEQEINPNRNDYHANLGLLYLKTGRHEDVMKEFERALSLNPGSSNARKGLSRLPAGQGGIVVGFFLYSSLTNYRK
jgi:tetratricopeptide (TPR) repeat protein